MDKFVKITLPVTISFEIVKSASALPVRLLAYIPCKIPIISNSTGSVTGLSSCGAGLNTKSFKSISGIILFKTFKL